MANLVLVVHFAYVLFVVGGLGLIWLGLSLRWRWVSNFWFRTLHLAAIGLVAVEAMVGWACPLTLLEDRLRSTAPSESEFVARWLHRLLFWVFPSWVFTVSYVAFALIVIATWVRWPPRPRRTGGG